MKGLYALDDSTFCSKYRALETVVSEQVWADLWSRWYISESFGDKPIEIVLPEYLFGVTEQQAFAELGYEDYLPEATNDGRILTKAQSRIILTACLSDCSAINWRSPEDSFFRDLVQANWQASQLATNEGKDAPSSWRTLINLPLESESCHHALYPWWLSAIRDFNWGLASPQKLNTLARDLKSPDVETWIAQTVNNQTQKHIPSLLAFIQKASDEGRWLFGMEWGT